MHTGNSHRMPLEGVRVIDFGWAWAGPSGTALLSFLGAEVIKVESWRRIDNMRRSVDSRGQQVDPNKNGGFNSLNLDKLAITVDTSRPDGIRLIKELVKVSDVVANNFSAGVIDRMGLGYEDLKEVRPDIILLSMSGFGGSGPLTGYRGYDPTFQSLSGSFDMSGYVDGPPARSALGGVMDIINGMAGVLAVISALAHRAKTGQGQYIDLAQWEVASYCLGEHYLDYAMNGRVPVRRGNRDRAMSPHNCYRCQGDDKWVSIAVATEDEWQALCRAMGRPELARDARFASAEDRRRNEDELDRAITEWTKQRTHYEATGALQKAGVAAMPCLNQEELLVDPHLRAREWFATVEHCEAGPGVQMVPPLRLSETPGRIARHAPLVGGQNDYAFCELLALPVEDFANLVADQVIA